MKISASINLEYPQNVLVKGQGYFADIVLNPEGANINAIGATIDFSKNISIISIEKNDSVMGQWVESPSVISSENGVHFSGIIPGGFSGYIDPFAPSVRVPAKILRIYFKAVSDGEIHASAHDFKAYLNDGNGTEIPMLLNQSPVSIVPLENPPANAKTILVIIFAVALICAIITNKAWKRKKLSKKR